MTREIDNGIHIKIVRIRQVCELTGLSKSCIYDKINQQSPRYDMTFPCQIKLGLKSVGWNESEIQIWLASRDRSNSVVLNHHSAANLSDVKVGASRIHEEPKGRSGKELKQSQQDKVSTEIQLVSARNEHVEVDAERYTIEVQRTRVTKEILEKNAKSGVSISYKQLMERTMLSVEDPNDVAIIERILESISMASHSEKGVLLSVLVSEEIRKGARNLPSQSFFKMAKSLGYSCDDQRKFVDQEIRRLYDIYNPSSECDMNAIWIEVCGRTMLTRVKKRPD